MEQEKLFTVVTANGVKKFKSTANTVAELKVDLNENGIPTENMAIQEGLTKIKFTSDSEYLPHDIPYKGTTTNNLVFRVTQQEKHISSGAGKTPRAKLYDRVKKLKLQDEIEVVFGKSFTQCKNSDLEDMIAEASGNAIAPEHNPRNSAKKAASELVETSGDFEPCEVNVKEAITLLTNKIVKSGILTSDDGAEILELIGTALTEDDSYTQEEIDAMFKDM